MLIKWRSDGKSVQIISSLVTIAGIALAIILHLQSQSVAELSYEHSRVTVFDSAQYSIPMLRVIDMAGNPIEGSVFIEQYRLRNSGNFTLSGENFPDALRIKLIGPGRILDATIEDATSPRIIHPAILVDRLNRLVEIKWIRLPEGEQILVEIAFSGEAYTRTDVDGYVISGNIVEFSALKSDMRVLYTFICVSLYTLFVYVYWRKSRYIPLIGSNRNWDICYFYISIFMVLFLFLMAITIFIF